MTSFNCRRKDDCVSEHLFYIAQMLLRLHSFCKAQTLLALHSLLQNVCGHSREQQIKFLFCINHQLSQKAYWIIVTYRITELIAYTLFRTQWPEWYAEHHTSRRHLACQSRYTGFQSKQHSTAAENSMTDDFATENS